MWGDCCGPLEREREGGRGRGRGEDERERRRNANILLKRGRRGGIVERRQK